MYTKLANSILTSTVWMESDQTRIVWLTLLAMCDKNGEVQASVPGLANVARVSVESCEKAMQLFLSPDPYSRTKTDEGRRIEEIDGGWMVLNHEKYRDLASDSDTKKKAAERQRRYRERMKRNGETVTRDAETVTGRDKSHQISHTDTKADNNIKDRAQENRIPTSLDDTPCRAAAERWFDYLDSKNLQDKSPRGNEIQLESWWQEMAKLGHDNFLAAVTQSIAAGRWNVELKEQKNGQARKDESQDWVLAVKVAKAHPSDWKKRQELLPADVLEALKRTGSKAVAEGNSYELRILKDIFYSHLKDATSGITASN